MSDKDVKLDFSTLITVVCSVVFSIYNTWFAMPLIVEIGFFGKVLVNVVALFLGIVFGLLGYSIRNILSIFNNPIPQIIGYLMPIIGPFIGALIGEFIWIYLFL